MRNIFILVFLIGISQVGFAQDSRTTEPSAKVYRATYTAEQLVAIREAVLKHPYTKYYDRLIEEYEHRMVDNVKKYKVMARKMQKPQYSDPSYFGHKRKPKKREVGKRKYCKECEIVH